MLCTKLFFYNINWRKKDLLSCNANQDPTYKLRKLLAKELQPLNTTSLSKIAYGNRLATWQTKKIRIKATPGMASICYAS